MKKYLALILVLVMSLSLVACGGGEEAAQSDDESGEEAVQAYWNANDVEGSIRSAFEASDGKIAIITNTVSQNEEEYRSAEFMVEKYGVERVIHATMPDNFMTEQEQFVSIVNQYASDPDVKCIIINQAVPGTNAAIDKVFESRDADNLLVIYCTPQESADDIVTRADFVLSMDEINKGTVIAEQAHRMGCKTLVHYSFPRHMKQVQMYSCRDLMKEKAEELGMEFVEVTAPDPTAETGTTGVQKFIHENVPQMVEKYGKETAFFSTNCSMQIPLIEACFEAGAYYPMPCCPSPYHGYPSALDIESPSNLVAGLQSTIDAINAKMEEAGLSGHFSTWAVPCSIANTAVATEYAWLWMADLADDCDADILGEVFKNYVQSDVVLTPYKDPETAEVFPEYFVYMQGFLTFGELTAPNA